MLPCIRCKVVHRVICSNEIKPRERDVHKVLQKPLVNTEGQKKRAWRTGPTAEILAGHMGLFLALPQISFLD